MKRINIESLEFKDLSFTFEDGKQVFSHMNFKIPAGTAYLDGPAGSGKKTFIRLLMGLLIPTNGAFLINGLKVNDLDHAQFDPFRLNIGHVFDVGGLLNNMTLYENFRMLMDYHDVLKPNERSEYIRTMLEIFQLDNVKHLRPSAVSSSGRKAACLLRAFLLRPQVLVMDDPTQGLDFEYVEILTDLIKEYQNNWSLKHVIICSDDKSLREYLPGRTLQITPIAIIDEDDYRRAGQ